MQKDLTLATLGEGTGEVTPIPFIKEQSQKWLVR